MNAVCYVRIGLPRSGVEVISGAIPNGLGQKVLV